MTARKQQVRSPRTAKASWRERAGVLALAGGIVSVLVVYLALNAAPGGLDHPSRNLLPYQTLFGALPESDQQLFRAIREALPALEAQRVAAGRWSEPAELAAAGFQLFAVAQDGSGYVWSRTQEGTIINYLGRPSDPAQPAWILEVQEPEPGMPPDPSPVDNEHHRLSDGTMIHLYTWMRRYGGQLPAGFVRQPQMSGWVQVFLERPNPLYYNRR